MSQLVTRRAALAQGLTCYFTGRPCKRGHTAQSRVTGGCVRCVNERRAELRAAAPGVQAAEQRAWRAANPERAVELSRLARADGKRLTTDREYREANKEKCNTAVSVWERSNPDKNRARVARRRAAKLRATPVWADQSAIAAVYAGAREMENLAGAVHVDHIYPLVSDWVCGLHVASNLQLLTPLENASKGNRPLPGAAT